MGPVTSSTRFAPISTEPSLRVRLVSWYFLAGGSLRLLSIVIAAVFLLAGPGPHRVRFAEALGLVVVLANALGSLWTGWLIAERRRLGLVIGGLTFAAPLVASLTGQLISRGGVIFCLVGLGLIASVWREVSDATARGDHDRD